MNDIINDKDTSSADLGRLREIAEDVIRRCRAKGASEADVAATIDEGLAVNVRLGEVETVERTRDRGVSVTVWFGKRKGSANTADLDPTSIEQTIEHACAIARYTETDPANGLPDAALLAREIPDLDLWHPWNIRADDAIRLGIEIEDAGRAFDSRIDNSEGASVNVGATMTAYANSLGFSGTERGTRHSLSCALHRRRRRGHAARLLVRHRAQRERFRVRGKRSGARRRSARLRGSARRSFRRAKHRCCSCPKSRAA